LIRSKLLLAVAFAFASLSGCRATNADVVSPSSMMPLSISMAGKVHRFNVEVANTAEEQAQGLMFRTRIAPDGGMIFPMTPPRAASFWMKNCPASQDWFFIRADGSIARLVENTNPYSLEPIGVDEPVAAVLEIAGGRAAELGITDNAKVEWPR
jgi:uncharacterized protein